MHLLSSVLLLIHGYLGSCFFQLLRVKRVAGTLVVFLAESLLLRLEAYDGPTNS